MIIECDDIVIMIVTYNRNIIITHFIKERKGVIYVHINQILY